MVFVKMKYVVVIQELCHSWLWVSLMRNVAATVYHVVIVHVLMIVDFSMWLIDRAQENSVLIACITHLPWQYPLARTYQFISNHIFLCKTDQPKTKQTQKEQVSDSWTFVQIHCRLNVGFETCSHWLMIDWWCLCPWDRHLAVIATQEKNGYICFV